MNIDGFNGDGQWAEGGVGDNIIISAPYAGLGLENHGKVYVLGEKRNGGNGMTYDSEMLRVHSNVFYFL